MMQNSTLTGWINNFLGCIGYILVCLGSYSKSTFVPGPGQSQIFSSDYLWTSSMNDIDMNANLSQRSHSSLSLPNPSGHNEFINHGLVQFNEDRANWTKGKKQSKNSLNGLGRMIGIYSTYDSLLGTNRYFRKPIPLSEMVEFLVDIWDEEGLYD